jgi:hypothetical protein
MFFVGVQKADGQNVEKILKLSSLSDPYIPDSPPQVLGGSRVALGKGT